MKTIAITYWNGLVSPLFDSAATALVFGADGGRRQIALGKTTLYAKADALMRCGCELVICGAISSAAMAVLQGRGMKVVPWIAGTVENVFAAYNKGCLETDVFFMPGCRLRTNRCRKRRRGNTSDGGRENGTYFNERQSNENRGFRTRRNAG